MNSVTATITGKGKGAARVPRLLDRLARAHRLPRDAVADMQVALDEVLSNILRHGFADGAAHRIEVTLSVDGQALVAEVQDDCTPFNPLDLPPPDVRAPLRDRPVGGLGVHFVRNLMSKVEYARVGARNRLVLRRSLTGNGGRGRNGVE